MYTSISLYRVPHNHLDAFLQLQREEAAIYRNYGALGDITLVGTNLEAKYGYLAFDDAIDVGEHEVVLVGLSSFRDRAHYDEFMKQVEADERISVVYHSMRTLLDIRRFVRGEFERVV